MTAGARHRLNVRLQLAVLALLGICAVSIPVTLALAFSTTGTSGSLTTAGAPPRHRHATATAQTARLRCTPAVARFVDAGRRAAAVPALVELPNVFCRPPFAATVRSPAGFPFHVVAVAP